MTNFEFMKQRLTKIVLDNKFDEALLTRRQASKFRRKTGTLYRLFRALPRAKPITD
jgi:hypothetical protein